MFRVLIVLFFLPGTLQFLLQPQYLLQPTNLQTPLFSVPSSPRSNSTFLQPNPHVNALLRSQSVDPSTFDTSTLHLLSSRTRATIITAASIFIESPPPPKSSPDSHLVAILRKLTQVPKPRRPEFTQSPWPTQPKTVTTQLSNKIKIERPSDVSVAVPVPPRPPLATDHPLATPPLATTPLATTPLATTPLATTPRATPSRTAPARPSSLNPRSSSPSLGPPPHSLPLPSSLPPLLSPLLRSPSTLKNVGPTTTAALARLSIHSVRALLFHFPTSLIDRTKTTDDVTTLPDGELATLILRVVSVATTPGTIRATCRDPSNNPISVTYFFGKSPAGHRAAYGTKLLFENKDKSQPVHRVVCGKVRRDSNNYFDILQPDLVRPAEEAADVLTVEPVYPLTRGLTNKKLRAAITQALALASSLLAVSPESLSPQLLSSLSWPPLQSALELAHSPQTAADVTPRSPARMRIAYEEMCLQQTILGLIRWRYKGGHAPPPPTLKHSVFSLPSIRRALKHLPFVLSPDQEKTLSDCYVDCCSSYRMSRLLQGDVGSGKTVVAYLLSLALLEREGGGCCTFLAPTTLLAEQHTRTLTAFVEALDDPNIRVESLTAAVKGAKREALFARISNPSQSTLLVGTHALTSAANLGRLSSLGLVFSCIDEEQRFGVAQRDALSKISKHTLYVSATPIPRSLALGGSATEEEVIVGALDVSTLGTKPKSARPVKTTIVDSLQVDEVMRGVKRQVNKGAKVFWVLPLIGLEEEDLSKPARDERENGVVASALERHAALSELIGDGRIGIVHGRMKSAEREKQIGWFADSTSGVDVLVGTTVLEVGIDIPQATILVVEGANKFGLSQLHQLRGRVGRAGGDDSMGLECHCVLLGDGGDAGEKGMERMRVLEETDNGFVVSLRDLEQRGPGDLLGEKQSGGGVNCWCVDVGVHWGMIVAAALKGRMFLNENKTEGGRGEEGESEVASIFGGSTENELLRTCLQEEKSGVFGDISVGSRTGLALRVNMALFGVWEGGGVLRNYDLLQEFCGEKNDAFLEWAPTVEGGVLEEVPRNKKEKWVNHSGGVSFGSRTTKPLTPGQGRELSGRVSAVEKERLGRNKELAQGNGELLVPKIVQIAESKLPSLVSDDVCFLIIDVETTGLSRKTSRIIQIAAKVFGSSEAVDSFSSYILPPEVVSREVESLTGIGDAFLRKGGVDKCTGVLHGSAPVFAQVYEELCKWCQERRGGRDVVLVAHNAKFDLGMLEMEVGRLGRERRLEGVGDAGRVPLLGKDTGVVSVVDTLALLRTKKLWEEGGRGKPPSFKQSDVYRHVAGRSMVGAHNAMGDVTGLEDILNSDMVRGEWRKLANKLQKALVVLEEGNL